MRTIPFSDIDKTVDYFSEGYAISHDEAYRRFDEVSVLPPDDLPEDPLSREYADRWMQIYQRVSARSSYDVNNECCEFDLDEAVLRPFPFYTGSLKLAAQHYSLIGKLLDVMDCGEKSDILEFGFGWGHTTLAMAMLGHRVTAVDIEDKYCTLVRRRAELFNVDVDVINSDFLWVEQTDKKFDAVVFFECFHHCWEFQRLLKSLHRVMKPGGKVYFGAEPINNDFPVPWGVRLDGQSLFVARQHGWMELGFHDVFFSDLLDSTGWRGECVTPHFWKASRSVDPLKPLVFNGDDSRLRTAIGHREGGALQVHNVGDDPTYALFGPYINLLTGEYTATIDLEDTNSPEGSYVDILAEAGEFVCGRLVARSELRDGRIVVPFTAAKFTRNIEVRLRVPSGFQSRIRRLTIAERTDEAVADAQPAADGVLDTSVAGTLAKLATRVSSFFRPH